MDCAAKRGTPATRTIKTCASDVLFLPLYFCFTSHENSAEFSACTRTLQDKKSGSFRADEKAFLILFPISYFEFPRSHIDNISHSLPPQVSADSCESKAFYMSHYNLIYA